MSGGVDSSVAAALLKREGHEVIGLMMRLWGHSTHNRCCTPDSMAQARRVAEMFDIPFYAVDAQAPFKERVVDFFTEGYSSGVTPNPCMECNRHIRWDFLLKKSLALGAGHMATGHYARVRQRKDSFELLKGVDPKKDQSYVLSVMGQAQLKHALFPVGEYPKAEIRQMARDLGLPVSERPDSQDLCFLGQGDYRQFLQQHAAGIARPGPIVTREGKVLGEHTGLPFYTLGQRKGIGIAAPHPLYVLAKDSERNALIVGPVEELGSSRLTAGRVNWIAGAPPDEIFRAQVKIRYKAPEVPATVTALPGNRIKVQFDQPVRDITPGQAAVLYDGEVCLGSGIILP